MKKADGRNKTTFSKDNPIVKAVSSKQSQIQTQNVVAPVKPKEIKKK